MTFRHINALIRYHLKIDPESLLTQDSQGDVDYGKYLRTWGELEWVLEREMSANMSKN